MRNTFCLILSIVVISFAGCNNAPKEETVLTNEKKSILDSVSKVRQKAQGDSLKKLNPLLIVPPDSAYTGEYTDKYPGGIIKFKGFFRFGKRHGAWMSFYPSGLKWSELHYDKGLREGPNMTYFESGLPRYSGFYKNDQQDSIWCYFDSTGKLSEKVLFKSDMVIKKLPLK